MSTLSKKAAKDIAGMINRLQVWTRIEANEINLGNVSEAKRARLIVSQTEVALADKYGIVLPVLEYSRMIVEEHERSAKSVETA